MGEATGDLYRVKGIMKKEDYLNILARHAVQCLLEFALMVAVLLSKLIMIQSILPNYARTTCREK